MDTFGLFGVFLHHEVLSFVNGHILHLGNMCLRACVCSVCLSVGRRRNFISSYYIICCLVPKTQEYCLSKSLDHEYDLLVLLIKCGIFSTMNGLFATESPT